MYETNIIFHKDIESTEEITTESTQSIQNAEESTTEETDIEYITTEGQIIDNKLYLSAKVNNADINDVYSICLSIRNIVLLFFMILLLIKFKGMIHNAINRTFYIHK